MLDSFMIIMSDEQFNILCSSLGLTDKKKKISYQDFLARFQIQDTPEGHKVCETCPSLTQPLESKQSHPKSNM